MFDFLGFFYRGHYFDAPCVGVLLLRCEKSHRSGITEFVGVNMLIRDLVCVLLLATVQFFVLHRVLYMALSILVRTFYPQTYIVVVIFFVFYWPSRRCFHVRTH